MFILSRLSDDVRVLPHDLSKRPLDAVTDVVCARYLDRIISDLGLVITLNDVEAMTGGYIYPNDGAAYFSVTIRLVIFRPFPGEVLTGKLKSSSRDGVRVSLGFFEDVLIPEHAMQEPSFFNEGEKLWVWKFDGNDLFMDVGEDIRFRVHALRFHSVPTPLEQASATGDAKLLGTAARPFAPMEVVGDINGDGLGLLAWWGGGEEEPDADAAG
jgi:DNA-directed RNA polymerase III subunit RPC8